MKVQFNIPDSQKPRSVKETFNLLKRLFGQQARMSDILQLIEKSIGTEFSEFDPKSRNPPHTFFSHLIDLQLDFLQGREVDLEELHKDIVEVYEFTEREKKFFVSQNIEEKLWAIFLILTNPAHEYYEI